MPLLATADQQPPQGFSFTNLLILIVVLAVLWPAMRWLRRRISERRRERYEREGDVEVGYTEDNDPDLRRNHPED
jgi:flagellar biosynthesis/type III secretory pathway M-ring protein FliF/YscJ